MIYQITKNATGWWLAIRHEQMNHTKIFYCSRHIYAISQLELLQIHVKPEDKYWTNKAS